MIRLHALEKFSSSTPLFCSTDIHDTDIHDTDIHDTDIHDTDIHDTDIHDTVTISDSHSMTQNKFSYNVAEFHNLYSIDDVANKSRIKQLRTMNLASNYRCLLLVPFFQLLSINVDEKGKLKNGNNMNELEIVYISTAIKHMNLSGHKSQLR